MKKSTLLLSCLLLSLPAATPLWSQLTQPFFHHYTTADGLPSSETYCVTQDRRGYLWFGTDNGAARFDGYEFKVYGISDGLTDVVVFNVVEDPHGKLWFSTYSGRIFYLKNNKFYPFEYNDLLIDIKDRLTSINLVDVLEDGTLILRLMVNQMIKISPSGTVSDYTSSDPDKVYIYHRKSNDGWTSFQSSTSCFNPYRPISKEKSLKIHLNNEKGTWNNVETIQPSQINFSFYPKKPFYNPNYYAVRPNPPFAGEIISSINDKIHYHSQEGEEFTKWYGPSSPNHAIPHHEKGFWVAMGQGGGLVHVYLQIKNDEPQIRVEKSFSNTSINYVNYDRNGGLWVCSQDQGIFYAPNPNINTYRPQSNNSSPVPVSLQLLGPNHYLAGYDDISLVEHKIESNETERFELHSQRIRTAFFMASNEQTNTVYMSDGVFDNQRKALIRNAFFFSDTYDNNPSPDNSLKEKSAKSTRFNAYRSTIYAIGYLTYLKQQPYSIPNRIFISSSYVGGYLDLDSLGGYSYTLVTNDTVCCSVQCLGQDHHGRFLLGTMEGLYLQDSSGRFTPNNLGISALDNRIVSIDRLINGGTLVATRGSGVVFISEQGRNVISRKDGLASDIIRYTHQSKNGDIWIATLSGLSKLRLNVKGEIEEIRSFTTLHGLASNEIHYIDSYENDIWLASGGGIIDFEEVPLNIFSPPVQFSTITVDGKSYSPDSLTFSQGQHDIKINFGTINYQMLGNIPYRYRLDPADEWEYTFSRTVEYPNLATGNYSFEVQSQNQDQVWSKSVVLPLYLPVNWYNHWLAYLSGLLLLIGFIGGIFKLREQRQRKERAIQDQIDELERAAVQAQMNPHFVFNSLNSIQYFILQSDTKQAVYYLSRFASLIRQTLKASVRGVHSLKDEIGMLEIYLSLEKLRFKESFEYRIEVDESLPASNIEISPMLVQPFVENAILHGLADVDSGGLVSVNFGGNAKELIVTVSDNGCGFDPAASITSDSMGSRITQRRLEKMGDKGSDPIRKRISIDSSTGEDGRPRGTTITLIIPSINQ